MPPKKPYAAIPSVLPTPHPVATPVGPRPTPAVPEHYTRDALLKHDSTDYAKLRHRAEAINAAKLEERSDLDWRKKGLTGPELYYLWNGQYGQCGNEFCKKGDGGVRAVLDGRSMTIDHIVPKHHYPSGKWDIRNLTILCHSCNASKGVNFLTGLVKPTLAPKAIIEYGNGTAAGGAGKGK